MSIFISKSYSNTFCPESDFKVLFYGKQDTHSHWVMFSDFFKILTYSRSYGWIVWGEEKTGHSKDSGTYFEPGFRIKNTNVSHCPCPPNSCCSFNTLCYNHLVHMGMIPCPGTWQVEYQLLSPLLPSQPYQHWCLLGLGNEAVPVFYPTSVGPTWSWPQVGSESSYLAGKPEL